MSLEQGILTKFINFNPEDGSGEWLDTRDIKLRINKIQLNNIKIGMFLSSAGTKKKHVTYKGKQVTVYYVGFLNMNQFHKPRNWRV